MPCVAHRLATSSPISRANYSSHAEDGPEKNYDSFVKKWSDFFRNVNEDFELERGLYHVFGYDWVPAVEVIEEALQACRRVNTFPTAVRVLEAVQEKTENAKQYDDYIKALKPLMDKLGVVEKKDLGTFDYVRQKRWWVDSH